jgi:hypothetical protein
MSGALGADPAMASMAYWTAEQCAVVLVLQFSRRGRDEPEPIAMTVTYSRGEDGRWDPPTLVHGGTSAPGSSAPNSQDRSKSPLSMPTAPFSPASRIRSGRPSGSHAGWNHKSSQIVKFLRPEGEKVSYVFPRRH